MSSFEDFLMDNVYPYTRSIIHEDDRGRPEFIGSGFCLDTSVGVHLITASHVMDHHFYGGKNLFFEYGGRLIRIIGNEICKDVSSQRERESDRFDISTIELDSSIQPHLGGVGIVKPDIVCLRGCQDAGDDFVCMGIPVSVGKKGVSWNDKVIDPVPYGFVAKEVGEDVYNNLRLSRNSHLVLNFNAKRAYTPENKVITPPALNGLSGTPVWQLSIVDGKVISRIVAILIEYHRRHKAVVCTRITELIGL